MLSFFPTWPILQRMWKNYRVEIRTADKKGKKVTLSMLLTHIHLYSYIFGVLQNTVIPSGTAFSRLLTQQAHCAEIGRKH